MTKTNGLQSEARPWYVNNSNNRSNANDRNNFNNNARFLRIAFFPSISMQPQIKLWHNTCAYENIFQAYKRARKHKTLKPYVIEFEADLENNLLLLRTELLLHSYRPKPLETFILRDPKTRTISKSAFRDRVIHHALCSVIEPIFEKVFIYDSYANRIGKGTLKAQERFRYFQGKVSRNNTITCFILKADVRHYFDEVDHKILIDILSKKINEQKIIWLIKQILYNYATKEGKGMPLGNLTSQFFANVYLNELDQFVKHKLKAECYLRYVDDFVILHPSKIILEAWKEQISGFLLNHLAVHLHPDKTKIITFKQGIEFLGFKVFPHHRILKRTNKRQFFKKYSEVCQLQKNNQITYDPVYDFMEGWIAYAKSANTYHLRSEILSQFEEKFSHEISCKEVNRGLPSQPSTLK